MSSISGRFAKVHRTPTTVREKTRLKRMAPRIVFPYTDEAHTAVIRYRGKRRFFRADKQLNRATKNTAQLVFCRSAIAHAMFPKHFPRPVGVTYILFKNPQHNDRITKHWGVVSELVKGRPQHYKRYQDLFYKSTGTEYDIAMSRNPDYIDQNAVFNKTRKLRQKMEASGISPNKFVVNMIIANGIPKFFEPPKIYTVDIHQNLHTFSESVQKRVRELLDEYTRLIAKRKRELLDGVR
jgi:hypothetical protein